jgi:hypothetical protein
MLLQKHAAVLLTVVLCHISSQAVTRGVLPWNPNYDSLEARSRAAEIDWRKVAENPEQIVSDTGLVDIPWLAPGEVTVRVRSGLALEEGFARMMSSGIARARDYRV